MAEISLDEVEKLDADQQELHKKIKEIAIKNGLTAKGLQPVLDGVADIKGYQTSSPKIMWVLKGAYPASEGNDEYYIWDCWNMKEHNIPTWIPLIKILYGLRHHLETSKRIELCDMKDVNQKMLDDFKKTAYINICKVPYDHEDDDLNEQAELWRDIVKQQVKLYSPDVIIFGGTYDIIKDHDVFTGNILVDKTPTEEIAHIYKNPEGTLLFSAWHPAYPYVYKKDLLDHYVDEIADKIYMSCRE
ncbi:MAG: hypothetical protein K2K25_02240 [Muribaculaceae bacterium]|nr:hypothetical protein [Muribaculaceae bacterium]